LAEGYVREALKRPLHEKARRIHRERGGLSLYRAER